MKLEIGSTVRFLNSTGGGRVVRIKDNIAYVEDMDGFEIPVQTRECVVVADPSTTKAPKAPEAVVAPKPAAPAAPPSKSSDPVPKPRHEEKIEEDLPLSRRPI